MKKLFVLLLIAHFIKEMLWLGIIPLWHFPDEEQHFAQTSFSQEKGRFPTGNEYDVSKEIDESSKILGTKRDKRGVNLYTYHPEYRIPYSKDDTGIFEEKIKALNTKENRQIMVKQEAARYGPVYYILSGIPYKIFSKSDLMVRVFGSRFISVILSTITVFIVYLISKEIFVSELERISLTFLVAFQPMFSFVSAGVNSDNLFNLVFSLILYSCLKIFYTNGIDLKYLLVLPLSFFLGFYSKKQIYIAFPIILLAFLTSFFLKKRQIKIKKSNLPVIASLVLVIGVFLLATQGKINIPEYTPGSPSKLKETFFQYIFWHLKHTIDETIPWYWGVFNWLGVTLPRWFNRIQSKILILSAIGFLVYLFKQIKNKNLFSIKNQKIIFLIISAGIYYFSVIIWDYLFRKTSGFSFGIQGRYFFPTIASHMLLMFIGLKALVPTAFKKLKKIFIKVIFLWWLFYSLIGLHTAVSAYYQIWPISSFLIQASQYKPVVFKSLGLTIITLAFFASTFTFLIKFIFLDERKN